MILEREGAKRPEEDDSGQRAALLEKVELFSGLSRIVLARIAASLDPVAFMDHEAACVQGEPGDSMYIVSSGAPWGRARASVRWRCSQVSRARRRCGLWAARKRTVLSGSAS